MPAIEPSPNSTMKATPVARCGAVEAASATRAAEPASPCIMPTARLRPQLPSGAHGRGRSRRGRFTSPAWLWAWKCTSPAPWRWTWKWMRRLDQHVEQPRTQQHQHDADREFEPARQPLVQGQLQRIDRTAEGAERQRVAQAPQRAMPHDGAEALLVRRRSRPRRQCGRPPARAEGRAGNRRDPGEHEEAIAARTRARRGLFAVRLCRARERAPRHPGLRQVTDG